MPPQTPQIPKKLLGTPPRRTKTPLCGYLFPLYPSSPGNPSDSPNPSNPSNPVNPPVLKSTNHPIIRIWDGGMRVAFELSQLIV